MKLAKAYEPKEYEPAIYGLWESSGAFSPSGQGAPYSIALPPPNANGNLHIGHALTVGLEDTLVRYYRMQGRDAVFIPGADHAGFETWVVYEKQLQKQGKSRFDFSREELYSNVWDFVEQQRGNMELQLRALGASVSWDDLVFTLDQKVITTAYDTFKQMWNDNLIYRGERMVNYCTYHQTSFSDIEVSHKNETSKLWKVAYPTLDKIGEIVVATTRPETIFGDVAIAVHPDDERYKGLIGTNVLMPITDREIPVIADEAVDPSFGTGAVKVTPAHDPTDFEIGERHKLPIIQVIGRDGKMTGDIPGAIAGLGVESARSKTLQLLKAAEVLRAEEAYQHSVGHCYECGTTIQRMIMEQWFVKVGPLAERAIEAIKGGDIVFTPASKAIELISYFEQLRDWNISRQPAWGIPIPAFQNIHDHNDWIFDTRVDQPTIEVNGVTYRREEDTFDTWFSSGQWPYIVTDYLSGGRLQGHYPLDVMETGHDLLRPWVARMIMLSLYRTGTVPFRSVYMHGMVLDEHGAKMSKSKGNVINPQEVIEAYGSDALRFGIVSARSAGQNQAFSVAKVIAGRNFCNKLWNIARYVETKLEGQHPHPTDSVTPETLADHWVMRQLVTASREVGELIETYRFAEAAEVMYHTIWDDVADWYIEASKQGSSPAMLAWVLRSALRLAHPFAPFVTETIWQTLGTDTLLIRSDWAVKGAYHEIAAAEFEQLQQLVSEVRFIAGEFEGKQTLLYEHDSLIADNAELIRFLSRLEAVQHVDQPKGLRIPAPNREAWLQVSEAALYEHQTKIEMRLAAARQTITRLEARLNNPGYVDNAPANIVEQTREQLEQQRDIQTRLQRELEIVSADK